MSRSPLMLAGAAVMAAAALVGCHEPRDHHQGMVSQISVQGSKTIELRPDYVQFTFQARREGKEVQPLKQQIDAVTNRVVAALAAFNIAEQDFTSSGVQVQRRFDYVRDQGQVFAGFTVSRDYELKVRNVNDYERIVDALTKAGVEDLGSAQVKLDDESAHARQALAAAVADARAKARAMATELDLDLGDAILVEEQGVSPHFSLRGQPEAMAMADAKSSAPPPMNPKDFSVTAQVRVTFEIDD